MRVLFLGDIVAKSGRTVVSSELPSLRRALKLDFVVANAENAAHGFGITEKICRELFEIGVDVITGGNHSWDKSEIIPYIAQEKRLLRPLNFPGETPGRGMGVYIDGSGRKIKVINIMTRLFMELLDDPFSALERELPLGTPKSAGFESIIIDVHGEATSEKMALGHVADGHASLVVGTHTHVPTADAHVLVGGTAFQDLGRRVEEQGARLKQVMEQQHALAPYPGSPSRRTLTGGAHADCLPVAVASMCDLVCVCDLETCEV